MCRLPSTGHRRAPPGEPPQERDRLRDHAHLAGALVPLRFTHGQIRFESGYVESVLRGFSRRA
jgi:hypothetical protein